MTTVNKYSTCVENTWGIIVTEKGKQMRERASAGWESVVGAFETDCTREKGWERKNRKTNGVKLPSKTQVKDHENVYFKKG